MIELTYRPATLDDAPGIARVHCESWWSTYRGLLADAVIRDRTDFDKRLHGWQSILSSDAQSVWVALRDDIVVGFASGGAVQDSAVATEDDCSGQLYALYLVGSAQRLGVGSALLACVLDDLSAAGHARVRVEVLEGNLPAIHFYEKHGATFRRNVPLLRLGSAVSERVYLWSLPLRW